jgi:hypothetical protein
MLLLMCRVPCEAPSVMRLLLHVPVTPAVDEVTAGCGTSWWQCASLAEVSTVTTTAVSELLASC